MVVINDRNMVVEENCGYINGEPKKTISRTVKKTQEQAEIDPLGIPSKEEMEQFLLHDIPIPSKERAESITEEEIKSFVPTVEEMKLLLLKKPETYKKTEIDEKVKTEIEEIAEALGVVLE
jgi:hypothetical protein